MKRFALALAALLLPLPAVAGTTGSIAGTVVSERNGAPIANVMVIAASGAQVSTTSTDSRGNFAFVSLTPDVYTVKIQKDGFQPVTVPGIAIFADTPQRLALVMDPTLAFVVRVSHVDFSSLVKPHIVSDIYVYSAAKVALAPPLSANLWALRMTPGITFGPGAAVMH